MGRSQVCQTPRATSLEIRALLLHLLFDLQIFIVVVLTGVRDLVLEDLDEFVEYDGDDGAHCGADPVDPVLLVEDAGHHARAKRPSRVERTTSVIHSDELGDEESETDAYGGYEGCWNWVSVCSFRSVENGSIPLCFSFASMKMVKTSSAVRIVSMKTP